MTKDNGRRPKYICGLGPPRSGTTSLARLLDGCSGVVCGHEASPQSRWAKEPSDAGRLIGWLRAEVMKADADIFGNVACWHLPSAGYLAREFGEAIRFPVILRPKPETIESQLLVCDGYCTERPRLDFPAWRGLDERTAWSCYWDLYVDRVLALQARFPSQVRIFSIGQLDDEQGQREIFDFCRVPEAQRVYQTECHHNRRRK